MTGEERRPAAERGTGDERPSREVRGVVVAHADLAHALVRAVEAISGVRGALVPVSNEGCSPEELRRLVEEAAGSAPAVLFVDLASGSCAFTGRLVARTTPDVAVVTGANLPMLLDFVFHRELELGALVERVREKGRGAVQAHTARPGPRPVP